MPELHEPQDLARVLTEARVVAILGAHPDTGKPAHFVPAYLHRHGYQVLPVNPAYPSENLWGRTPTATLSALDEPVDVVDVFRRSEHLPDHLPDILAMDPLPKVVWLQQGIRNDDVARHLTDAGIDVIQDACMLALHRKLGLSRSNPVDLHP